MMPPSRTLVHVDAPETDSIRITVSCPFCGVTYDLAKGHACLTPGRKPHRCPVCEGRGKLQYDPVNPFVEVASSAAGVPMWECRPCGGTGIVWG